MGIFKTKYVWRELTYDGRLIEPEWATKEGYAHEAEAMVHYYMKFSAQSEQVDPKYTIIKLYGV